MTESVIQKVVNPRTGLTDFSFLNPSEYEIASKCEFLRIGQKNWRTISVNERVDVLKVWKENIEAAKPALIDALSKDTGRMSETLLEVEIVGTSIDRWSNIAISFFEQELKKSSSIPFLSIQQDFVPFPLVAVISPWNFPLLLSLIDAIPALLAGCSVIVKPSEVTPRFIEIIQQTINKTPILRDVLFYVTGNGSVGEAMVANADIVCFTGSTSTGKKVYRAACERFIPVFLELGGKDPALVFEGADLELASSAILWGSTVNAGQSCLSIERVYVQDTVFEDFVDRIVAKTRKIKLAFPSINDGQIGPIISSKQVEIIDKQLADALAKGAKILCGNEKCQELNGGFYCEPTILTNVNHSMKIMQEETFGPIVPLMSFSTEQEAISLANGTIYGLSGAVFHSDIEKAIEIGKQIEGGAISINDAALTAIMHEGEKNSFKMSGIGGTRMGPSAIKRFMRQKTNLIKTNQNPDPWWF